MTEEQMLARAADQAWSRLQQAYELENQVFERTPAIDLFNDDLERFKVITRHIAECERIWRRTAETLAKHRKSLADSAPLLTPAPDPRPETPPPPQRALAASATWDNETTPPRFALPGLCSTASPCTARASTT